jgi:hypothetical protein
MSKPGNRVFIFTGQDGVRRAITPEGRVVEEYPCERVRVADVDRLGDEREFAPHDWTAEIEDDDDGMGAIRGATIAFLILVAAMTFALSVVGIYHIVYCRP